MTTAISQQPIIMPPDERLKSQLTPTKATLPKFISQVSGIEQFNTLETTSIIYPKQGEARRGPQRFRRLINLFNLFLVVNASYLYLNQLISIRCHETNALELSSIHTSTQDFQNLNQQLHHIHKFDNELLEFPLFKDDNLNNAGPKLLPEIQAPSLLDLANKLSPFHNIEPDAHLDPPAFIRERHFIPEVHHVITRDNYILTMHRIINPLVPHHLRSKLKPVLLQHGLFTSSFNYLIISDRNLDRPRFDPKDITRTWPLHVYTPQAPFSWQRLLETINDVGPAKLGLSQTSDRIRAPQLSDSLAFEMANQGYDVWLGNSRGSTYSLNHTQFDYRSDWRYWDFSFHEIGLFDLPAQINYILALRRRNSLAYVGHSQGNLAMFILQSFYPEWSRKVKPFIAAAPVAFIPSAYFGALRLFIKTLSPIITPRRLNELMKGQIFPTDPATGRALDLICVPKWSAPVCSIVLDLLLGDNIIKTNDSLVSLLAHHIPAGTSIRNILHYAQLVESGQFQAFDFGPRENLRRYGSFRSPFYPIWRINSTDIALIVGRTDPISTQGNVAITRKMLRVPLMDDFVVPDLIWGHSDHMYASGSGLQVNSHLIGLVDRYRLVDN